MIVFPDAGLMTIPVNEYYSPIKRGSIGIAIAIGIGIETLSSAHAVDSDPDSDDRSHFQRDIPYFSMNGIHGVFDPP
jgi:hypothetical protein